MWECNEPFWEGFWVLHRSRSYAVGLSGAFPIGLLYSEISRYAQDHGLDIDDAVQLIGVMDQVFLAHTAEKK